MPTLGGSVFIRNAIKYDFCIEESLLSLIDACDDVVLLDCQSDDGTTERLREFCGRHPKVRLFEGGVWECEANYLRLSKLANDAIGCLDTDWHFMIQGDEVLHESSLPHLRRAIETAKAEVQAFACRRVHLFGNIDHQIRHDIPMQRKPSNDMIARLGRKGTWTGGDAEALTCHGVSHEFLEQIVLFHYSYVRKNEINLSRSIDALQWFFGKGSQPDQRLVEMKNKDNVFRPEVFFNWSELRAIPMPHPKYSKEWADARRGEFGPCQGCSSGSHP